MQPTFQDNCLFFCGPLNPPPMRTKLFPHVTATTLRRRCITFPSAASTIRTNVPDSASAAPSDVVAFDDYQLLFSSQPAESADPLPLLNTEGTLPPDFPLGTYYLTGPGMIADGHGYTVNPIDGHGYLRAFRFVGGGVVMYSARYVETEAAREEREAETGEWRFRRPGLFSVFKSRWTSPSSNLRKNVANTTVLSWGGRLFCLWEGGHPHELEPTSLATIGLADLITMAEGQQRGFDDGVALNLAGSIAKPLLHVMLGRPPKRTLPHYKIDAQRNRLLILCCDTEDIFLPQSNFTFYEFDSKFELKQKKKFLIPDQLLIHDWAFTDSHYIIMGNRIKLDVPGAFLAVAGLAPVMSTVSLNPSKATTPIYLLPRYSDDTVLRRDWRIPVEAPSQLWTLHMGNTYEEKDGGGNTVIKIQASACSYQWFNYSKMFGYDWQSPTLDPSFMNVGKQELAHLVQISIELDARGSCHWCSIANSSTQWKRSAEFPVINPTNSGKTNRLVYFSSTSGFREFLPHFPYDTVVKLDCFNGAVNSWCTESRRFIGEPMFIPRKTSKDEDNGYIIVIEYAVFRRKCYLVVLDAKRIGFDDAVVVKLEVPQHLNFPIGFHGFWDGK